MQSTTDSQVKRNQNGRNPIGRRAQRGVSLLEVLVVLVILVVGILVIIRLFPSGFFSIQSTGNAALADALGSAAIGAQNQDTSGIADAVLPGPLDLETNPTYTSAVIAQYSDYDPDNPNTLDNARRVSNETITVPAHTGGNLPIYVVNYGPIALPAGTVLAPGSLANYLTINSPNWQTLFGDSTAVNLTPPVLPQDTLGTAGVPRYLVDNTLGKVAVPTAPYAQTFVLKVVAHDPMSNTNKLYTIDFQVPASGDAGPPATTSPVDLTTRVPYLDSTHYYNGGWFDPIGNNTNASGTYKYNTDTAPAVPPSPWISVSLYRAFTPVATPALLQTAVDPYSYTLTAPALGDSNPGAIAFSPLASGGNGVAALKAQITYQTYSWTVLREDHDIPAPVGGSSTVIRTAVQNLLQAGSELPGGNNALYTGIAGSGKSLVILNLDTGLQVAPPGATDPTNPDAPVNDEDTNGPITTDPTVVNVSYSTGRLTFGSNVFGDTRPHRIRLYYQSSLDWTVAVQKPPSYYMLSPNSANTAGGSDPVLKPAEYAYDFANSPTQVYFTQKDAGKTIEFDGTYTASNGTAQSFQYAVAVLPTVTPFSGTPYVYAILPLPGGVTSVTLNTVRGLSSRAVVAWKERDLWKVHTVDTILNRTP